MAKDLVRLVQGLEMLLEKPLFSSTLRDCKITTPANGWLVYQKSQKIANPPAGSKDSLRDPFYSHLAKVW
jgi:hypothetical protein